MTTNIYEILTTPSLTTHNLKQFKVIQSHDERLQAKQSSYCGQPSTTP